MQSMRCSYSSRVGLIAVAGAVALLLGAAPAGAVVSCTTTLQKSSNFTMNDDYAGSSAGPCFRMTNGADLKTNGYTITGGAGNDTPAVECDDPGSVIQSDSHNDGDHVDITGYDIGVLNCTDVKDLLIEAYEVGVKSLDNDADLVSGNVIHETTIACIDADMTENTDKVSDNVCLADGGDGIRIDGASSGLGPQIQKNVIRRYDDCGIDGTNTIYRVTDNVLVEPGGGNAICIGGGGATTDDNVCEDDTECECDLNDVPVPVECLEALFG